MPTDARKAALEVVQIILEAISDSGDRGLPSEHLYSMLAGLMDFETYTLLIDGLKRKGLITNKGHLLKINR